LLEFIQQNFRQMITRDLIIEKFWGNNNMGESNIIEVYIRALRIKLEASNSKRLLHTVRGVGYVLREQK
jgi:DNA-binding response OmpR family regulator